MLKKDFLIFFVIYMIFVIGFSQGKRNITLNQKIALSHFYNSLFFAFVRLFQPCFSWCLDMMTDQLTSIFLHAGLRQDWVLLSSRWENSRFDSAFVTLE